MTAKKSDIDMLDGALLPSMLRFALPLMASSVLQLLFNASDIAVVGHFGSTHSLAAVGSTTTLISLLTNFFIGLSIGTNVLASRCLGAMNFKRLRRVAHTSIALGIVAGLFSATVGLCFSKRILTLMQTPETVLPLSLLYTNIYFFGMVPTAIYNFGAAILYANGDTRKPLLFLIVSGCANVVLNLVFVIGFKMDVAGVATATVIAQTLAMVLVLTSLARRRDSSKIYFNQIRFHADIVWNILKLGVPAGFQSIVFSLSNMVIQSAVNSFGPVYMAGTAASQNVDCFIWISMNAFQPTATTFISRNIGARRYARINKIAYCALACAVVTGVVIGGFAVYFGTFLLGLYTGDASAVSAGLIRLRTVGIPYALCGLMDVMTGALRGLGSSFVPAVISLLGACGLRLAWIATLFQMPEHHTFTFLFLSYPVSWAVTAAILAVAYFVVRRKYPETDEPAPAAVA